MDVAQLSDGRSISFRYDKCDKEHSPTIVFVHGFPLDHSMWQQQLPLQQHASLLMPDLPGFGKSDSVSGEFTMRSVAGDVASLLDKLNIQRAIFCGLSMGGYIGWEFAKHHGEKLAGLICCNTRATADDEVTARARRLAAAEVMTSGAGPVAETMRSKLFSDATIGGQSQRVNSVAEVIGNTAPETIAAAQLAMSKRIDASPLLGDIDIPTLVVAGADDPITPADEMQAMALDIPGSTFVELAQAGHMSPLERPEAFNHAVVHWLNR